MKKIGRKRSVITVLKMIWESELFGEFIVYGYLAFGFMLVLRVLVFGA